MSGHPFMGRVYVGKPVPIGTLKARYEEALLPAEVVEVEFEGLRDMMVFTNLRAIVFNTQGMTGKRIEVSSFAWRSLTAISVETAGLVDFDADLKLCGEGWGVCAVSLSPGSDVKGIQRYLAEKLTQ